MRLHQKTRRILWLLQQNGPMYGLDLVEQGAFRRGVIYVTLDRLEKSGLIGSHKVPQGAGLPPRRKYHATAHGLRMLWEDSFTSAGTGK